jgi:lipoprotein-anchoring transpeptidase ErfK/SrfK
MTTRPPTPTVFLALLVLSLSACGPYATLPGRGGYLEGVGNSNGGNAPKDDVSYWDGDGVSGPPRIVIDRRLLKAYFYKGDQLVGVSKISTGKEGHNTPAGHFKITQKDKDHRSTQYGKFIDKITHQVVDDGADLTVEKTPPGCYFEGARMPYYMRFYGGIGMHTGYLPGYNASHGCVRMPDRMAKVFFENVEVGTPVIVK